MTGDLVDLSADHHVHSTFSDDATSSLEQNVVAARSAGLHTMRATEHVRTSSTWVPDFLRAVAAIDTGGLTLLTGVESKMLDADGRLDLPVGLPFGPGGLDRVLIADHQFPGPDGPWTPSQTRRRMAEGWAAADLLDLLIEATVRAIATVPAAQLAHPFSLLPKIGLTEADLGEQRIRALGSAAAAAGCLVEVNEKWGCPGPGSLAVLAAAGVSLVASTDSHAHTEIGQYPKLGGLLTAVRT